MNPLGKPETENKAHHSRRWPFEYLIGLTTLASLAAVVLYVLALSRAHLDEHLLLSAKSIASVMHESRVYYSSQVVKRLKGIEEIEASHQYRDKEFGIPNPATFSIELGHRLNQISPEHFYGFYSNFPFIDSTRKNIELDKFANDALAFLSRNPDSSFKRIEKHKGQRSLRFAQPVIMAQSCIGCHNNHPKSTRNNWQVGDVRGVLEITLPYDIDPGVGALNTYRYGFLVALTVLLFSIGALMVLLWRRSKLVLKHEVAERTAELSYQAQVDSLTGIANRRAFDEKLERECRISAKTRHSCSLILFDVDDFKKYNDHYGHPAGDDCLKRIAQAVEAVLRRDNDTVARYGGEEFAVILPGADTGIATQIAREIQTAIANMRIAHTHSSVNDTVTVSLGINTNRRGKMEPKSLIQGADKALYKAKHSGKNRFAISE